MVNSREKGARAERLLAEALREVMGWTSARRSQQFCGKGETADLVIEEMPGLFVESKMVEKLSIHPVMQRAAKEAGMKLPLVAHKKKRTEWLVTLRLTDLPRLCRMIASSSYPTGPSEGWSRSDST